MTEIFDQFCIPEENEEFEEEVQEDRLSPPASMTSSSDLSPVSSNIKCDLSSSSVTASNDLSSLSPMSTTSSPTSTTTSGLVSRKISCAFSETDSGVDVESEEQTEDNVEQFSLEKKVIRPDQDIISRLCNFDEEDEDDVSEVSSESDDQEEEPDKMTLSLVELRHIMSALVNEHIEERLECGVMGQILMGRKCSVCHQNIFSMFVHTGYRCEVCSFVVCSHCCSQVTQLTEDQTFSIPVDSLTPSSMHRQISRQQQSSFSSLSVLNLAQEHNNSLSVMSLPSSSWLSKNVRRWSLGSRAPTSPLCLTCSNVIAQ